MIRAAALVLLLLSFAARAEENPGVARGPQFLVIMDENEMLATEQVLNNDVAVERNNEVMQGRAYEMLRKLHATKPVFWVTQDGLKLRWAIEWSFPRLFLHGLAASRYHCRQTHGLHAQFKGNPSSEGRFDRAVTTEEDGVLVDHWGEDGGLDENENRVVLSPSECQANTQRAEALYKHLCMPDDRGECKRQGTFGGVRNPPPAPWAWLFYAIQEVQ